MGREAQELATEPRDISEKTTPMSRPVSMAIIAILATSTIISLLIGSVLSTLHGPDERHHYSYIKHVAENPLPYPPRLEAIRTATTSDTITSELAHEGDRNHLRHPPLYYYLMAIPYRMLAPENHVPEIADQLDRHGGVSMRWGIPPLRAASILFSALWAFGTFWLLHHLVRRTWLRQWAAVVFALCSSFVPAYTFISGTLNNDALSLAVWPFLALSVFRFVEDGRRSDGFQTVLLCGIAVLTKASLWPLAFSAATALVLVAWIRLKRKNQGSETTPTVAASLRSIAPRTPTDYWWFSGAVATTMLVIAYVVATIGRYGSLLPSTSDVYSQPLGNTTPAMIPAAQPMGSGGGGTDNEGAATGDQRQSRLGFAIWWFGLAVRSLFGILSHGDKIYPANHDRIAQLLILMTAAAFLVIVYRIVSGNRNSILRPTAAAWMLLTASAYVFLASQTQYDRFFTTGHVAAQGRYLIGYVDIWLLGFLLVLSRPPSDHLRSRVRSGLMAAPKVAMSAILIVLFVNPLLFLSQSTDPYRDLGIESLVRSEARYHGFEVLDLKAVTPPRFVEHGVHPAAVPPEGSFTMAWHQSELASVQEFPGSGCIDLWVHAWGSRAWGEDAKLSVASIVHSEGRDEVLDVEALRLPSQPEVGTARLDARSAGESVRLSLRFENARVEAPTIVHRFWPQGRSIELIEVYYRNVKC